MKLIITLLLVLAGQAFAAQNQPTNDGHPQTASSPTCDADATFTIKGASLYQNYYKVLDYTKQKVYIADNGPISLARGDLYNDMRPSAIVVSHPYPTRDVNFFKVILQQQNQKTTKVTVYYHQDNPGAQQLLDELKAALAIQ